MRFSAQSADGTHWNRMYICPDEAARKLLGHCRYGYVREISTNKVVWIVYQGRILRPEEFHRKEMDRQMRVRIFKVQGTANHQRQQWRNK